MADLLTITVNEKKYEVRSAPDTPLLYVLRNELNLNGPRMGCGLEQCGACAVLLGSRAIKSCKTPVVEPTRGPSQRSKDWALRRNYVRYNKPSSANRQRSVNSALEVFLHGRLNRSVGIHNKND